MRVCSVCPEWLKAGLRPSEKEKKQSLIIRHQKKKAAAACLLALLSAGALLSAHAAPSVAAVAWQSCQAPAFKGWFSKEAPAARGLECAVLAVPLSYQPQEAAHQREVKLALTRQRAKNSHGALLFIAGGPGQAGINPLASKSAATQQLLSEYDLIGYSPRGVAPSLPTIACPAPDKNAQVYESKEFVESCIRHMGADTLKYMSARDAVEDVESSRRALGNERLNLVSYSYGTKVAALYAQRYPAHVRSAVLDGVVDLAEDYTTQRLTQEQGYQHTFEQFAAWCAHSRPDCPLAAEPEAANQRMHTLLAKLNAHPLTDKQGEAIDSDALIGLMSTEILWQEGWPDLAQTLRDLQKGRTGSYNRLKYQSPMGEHEQDALTVISCADAALQLPREQELQRLRQIDDASRFDNYRAKSDEELLEPCSYWPHAGTDIVHTPKPDPSLPKLLFVAQTHDGTTPYRNAQAMAAAFSGHLLTREGTGHTLVLNGLSECVDKQVADYLLDPAGFVETQVCRADD